MTDARERVLRLIDFLAEYDARKNPPVHDVARYGLFILRDTDVPDLPGVRLTPGADIWLSVDFVELPARPHLEPELETVLGPADRIAAQHRPEVSLDDDASDEEFALAERAERWVIESWEPWAEAYRDAEQTKRLYRDLFEQRERLAFDRDSVEFVWGFGRLRWAPEPQRTVDYPLLTIPVEIEHHEDTNELRVRPAGALTVESSCLAGLPLDDRPGYVAIRSTFLEEELAPDPWDSGATTETLRRLVRAIDHDGSLVGEGHAGPTAASLDTSWVLFMRRRRPDYQGFLDRLRELYKSGAELPDPMQALVIDAPSSLNDGDATSASDSEPLLLPKETNEEQQQILRLARHTAGVTVQGPPGTGKSHTIANIISHYVAYGRRVLVVAEKEQALAVLAEKIPEGIRDLTVSVLGADEQGRRRLESAIGQIQTRVTGLDKQFTDQQIETLTGELDRVSRDIAKTTTQLLDARRAEVAVKHGTWEAGDELTPSVAARWVAQHAATLGYIDDALGLDTDPPCAPGEFAELLSLIERVTIERAEACSYELPDLTSLPDGAELAARFGELDELRSALVDAQPEITSWDLIDASGTQLTDALHGEVRAEREWVARITGSWLDNVRAQLRDPLLAAEWRSFVAALTADREQAVTVRRALAAHDVVVPATPDPALVAQLREARQRLEAKGKLGAFAKDAKRALAACSIDGRKPISAADVDVCVHALRLHDLRRQLVVRWRNQVERLGGPALEAVAPEEDVGGHLDDLVKMLDWGTSWIRLVEGLRSIDVSAPATVTTHELARLDHVMDLVAARRRERAVTADLDALQVHLRDGANRPDASHLWGLLENAFVARRTEQWNALRDTIADLAAHAPAARRLQQLRRTLSASVPIWTSRILCDVAAAGDPNNFVRAWQWRQLDTWIASIDQRSDPAALQARIETLSIDRRRVVTDLVTERAWRRLADNLGDRQRQALNSYLQAVKRYGKTGGKYAARWLAEIRKALDESKDAVPVWIMPTNRALTSFRPDGTPPFDVLVIDEASQLGLDAIPLLSLARTAIVVGDDKQTSPENVGLDRSTVFDLLDEHLAAVPSYRTLFDPETSLYDIAFQKFPDVVMLTEHFRCLPPIIEFSNIHAYDHRIIPLRDQPPRPGWIPLGAIKVEDGYRSGAVNDAEAEAVVDLIEKLCSDPDYDAMDFGVISLLGTSQAKLISDKLYYRLGPNQIDQRRLRCGDAATFQGDERDVIVISTVVATDPANPSGRFGAMTKRADERRINVAASRAKNQMWVVHSVDADRFATGDWRGDLIRHCENPGALGSDLELLLERCESDFERQVVTRILAHGYRRVLVQHQVGRFRIDIVVEGPDARLAVECDGDRWHGEDVWHRDRARQEVLERAGWTFTRIRGSAFYRDPDQALEPLWERLETLGIPTGDDWVEETPMATVRTVTVGPANDDAVSDDEARVDRVSRAITRENGKPIDDVSPRASDAEGRNESDGTKATASLRLPSYVPWTPRTSYPEVHTARRSQLIEALIEIIGAEGPVHAIRAYQLYIKASGGRRVGRLARQLLNQAAHEAVKRGLVLQLRDDVPGQANKTLYCPGREPVVVRQLGPRVLSEVPRSEVQRLMAELGDEAGTDLKRAVLDAYGLTRLTDAVNEYLDDCRDYRWLT